MKGIKWPYNKDIISIAMAMKGVFTKGIERDGERGGGEDRAREAVKQRQRNTINSLLWW